MIRIWAKRYLQGDPVIWMVVLLLSAGGILIVYSTTSTLAYRLQEGNTEYYLFKHVALLIISLMVMYVVHKANYRIFARISTLALWLSVPLLLFTWMYGDTINQASRWLTIPIVNQAFQPSDLAKLALITHLAGMLSRRQQAIQNFRATLIPVLCWCGSICALIALSNISTAGMLFATCMLLMFIGRVPVKYLLLLGLIGGLFVSTALLLGQRAETARTRIENFIDKKEVPFQAVQSYIAIATGGVKGKGWGNSDQRNILPHSYSDFVFAIIVEEYGLVGGVVVIFLYLTLLYRGMQAVSKSDRAFGGLLSAGLSFAIVIQAMINMGVAVGLGPVTGLPLPLVSMGGTSLLFTGVALGIILSTSKQKEEPEEVKYQHA
ncbi:FtsW/RodA/SpoVE family cell cycle protein [Catalinimonas niigatensis]|uniref:FtsW/RodA/SpoVE family cell cycle protein n=1 Tax=Catalinimonas niigatensis TaxID=1397264 RepID=UPI002665609E|nr:FtsW/RodA/SpoVE family cell cycle protein [Catalinimonas niigatensis]WPP53176.1 FtsW/RodA/SpoVE family cell cycle protein [Catalinimonas niigatensis]